MLLNKIKEGYQSLDSFVTMLGERLPIKLKMEIGSKPGDIDLQERIEEVRGVFKKHKPPIFIEDHLGSGGFADVFSATSYYSGVTSFAIKILRPELLEVRKSSAIDPEAEEMRIKEVKQRFKNESYVQWDLSQSLSPRVANSVVRVFDHGEFDSRHNYRFILMERMASTLRDFIANKDNFLNTPEQLSYKSRLMEVIAWNIDSIHQEGIFHRDIKPENILFPRNPLLLGSQERRIAVKMGDFGTVRWVNSFTDKYDAVIIGSQCYMSPEQIHNPRHLDPRTDIYSFGVVCYELLYGMHPKNVNSDTSNLLEKLVMAKPVRRRPPAGFEGLNDIIFKCMRSKHRRHQSMHEVVQELHAFNASHCGADA